MTLADALLPGLVAYAIAVAGYVNLPEAIAHARAAGVLERLRGTPLPRSVYLAGRLTSSLLVGAAATAVLVVVAVADNSRSIPPGCRRRWWRWWRPGSASARSAWPCSR